jgi:hypothetical protein
LPEEENIDMAECGSCGNGLAERAVPTFKRGLKKSTTGVLEAKLSQFFFHYRVTHHSTTRVYIPSRAVNGSRTEIPPRLSC